MKKILLATTVLGMTAGFAAADVSVSGDARMGVVSTDGDSVFSSRMRIKFSGSGTTDGGLSFGGSFRANDAQGAKAGTAGSVFISGAFGKISMGDVDGGDDGVKIVSGIHHDDIAVVTDQPDVVVDVPRATVEGKRAAGYDTFDTRGH